MGGSLSVRDSAYKKCSQMVLPLDKMIVAHIKQVLTITLG